MVDLHLIHNISLRLISRFEKKKILYNFTINNTSAITSISNDFSFEDVFRQIEGIGMKDDVLIAISTSGKSKNILKAISKAKRKNDTIGI